PLDDPYAAPATPAARPGARSLRVELCFQGRPLAGALVKALRREQPEQLATSARTDADGRCELELGAGGAWLVKAVHMEPARDPAQADFESWWASLTFELPAAPEAAGAR